VVAAAEGREDASRINQIPALPLKRSAWFGFHTEGLGNAQLLLNRGHDLFSALRGL